jgi:glycosyltransferase involved in cell wall biosynthesis
MTAPPPKGRPLRVLLVAHHALPHVGGVEALVDQEIRALLAAGHRVVLVTSAAGGPGPAPEYPPEVRVVRVPAWHVLERRFGLPYPLFGPSLLPTLWREAGRCDVVHAHGFVFMNSVLALAAGRLRGRRRILTDHGGLQQFRSRLTTALLRLAAETVGRLSARLADRLVSYNTRIAGLLERLAGTRAKTLFLPNPIDWGLFHPPAPGEREAARAALDWSTGRPKVLFVGRLTPEKGVPLLVQAADPAYDLVFCGPGDPALLGPLPRPGVVYLPPRPRAGLAALYHAADVLAAPSDRREGFPVVVQEALACGLRVVMTYEEGYAPYRGLPGLTFCERDVDSLRAALRDALARPAGPADADRAKALDALCPSPEAWVRLLFAPGGAGRPARAASHHSRQGMAP